MASLRRTKFGGSTFSNLKSEFEGSSSLNRLSFSVVRCLGSLAMYEMLREGLMSSAWYVRAKVVKFSGSASHRLSSEATHMISSRIKVVNDGNRSRIGRLGTAFTGDRKRAGELQNRNFNFSNVLQPLTEVEPVLFVKSMYKGTPSTPCMLKERSLGRFKAAKGKFVAPRGNRRKGQSNCLPVCGATTDFRSALAIQSHRH